jgi:hypothetical protein
MHVCEYVCVEVYVDLCMVVCIRVYIRMYASIHVRTYVMIIPAIIIQQLGSIHALERHDAYKYTHKHIDSRTQHRVFPRH